MPRADHRDRNFAGVCRSAQHLKTLSLVVSPKRWRRVANLHDSGPDDRHFELAFRDDGGAAIRLGDGLHGMRLPLGSRLALAYWTGAGEAGAIELRRSEQVATSDQQDLWMVIRQRTDSVRGASSG